MMKAIDVANYFLYLSKTDEDDLLDNLKMQKLLYYAQGFSLALNGTPMFEEPIIKWKHGPVVRDVYFVFKSCGSDAIEPCEKEEINVDLFDSPDRAVLGDVYRILANLESWELRHRTHLEPPWKYAKMDKAISHRSMQDYFRKVLNGLDALLDESARPEVVRMLDGIVDKYSATWKELAKY